MDAPDLTDDQRAALATVFDGLLHELEDGGPDGHADTTARHLDEDDGQEQEPTDVWDDEYDAADLHDDTADY